MSKKGSGEKERERCWYTLFALVGAWQLSHTASAAHAASSWKQLPCYSPPKPCSYHEGDREGERTTNRLLAYWHIIIYLLTLGAHAQRGLR